MDISVQACGISVNVAVQMNDRTLRIQLNAFLAVNALLSVKVLILESNSRLFLDKGDMACQSAQLSGTYEITAKVAVQARIRVNGPAVIEQAKIQLIVPSNFAFTVGVKISILSYKSRTGTFSSSVDLTFLNTRGLPTRELPTRDTATAADVQCDDTQCFVVGVNRADAQSNAGSNSGSTAGSNVDQNTQIGIGVGVGVGGAILIAVIIAAVVASRRRRVVKAPMPPPTAAAVAGGGGRGSYSTLTDYTYDTEGYGYSTGGSYGSRTYY